MDSPPGGEGWGGPGQRTTLVSLCEVGAVTDCGWEAAWADQAWLATVPYLRPAGAAAGACGPAHSSHPTPGHPSAAKCQRELWAQPGDALVRLGKGCGDWEGWGVAPGDGRSPSGTWESTT